MHEPVRSIETDLDPFHACLESRVEHLEEDDAEGVHCGRDELADESKECCR